MNYARERGLLEGGLLAQPGGKQPHDRGNSRIAKALGIDRKQVREARAHGEICEEAKKLIRLNGLDGSVKALNSVANCSRPEAQLAQAQALVVQQRKPARGRSPRNNSQGLANAAAFLELKREWEVLPFQQKFNGAPLEVRRRFIKEILTQA